MNKRLAIPALAATAFILPACTQILLAAAPPVIHDPASVPAGTYAIEPSHTQVVFSVNHFGFTTYFGNFSDVSGSLSVVPKNPSAMSVSVSVPVSSVSTTSPKLTDALKAADWLDAAHYPAMIFRSTSVTPTGKTTADIAGTLTLHGVTKPLVLHATFNGAGVNILDQKQTVGFQLTGTVKRSEFGVAKYVPLVSDEVQLIISAAFEK